MSQPKTSQRRSNFRRANRTMPRRRIDITIDAIDYKNPDLLKRFVTESGKDPSAPDHGNARALSPEDHPGDQAGASGAADALSESVEILRKWPHPACGLSVFRSDSGGWNEGPASICQQQRRIPR
jgi:ribosomal protein S18